MIRSEKIILNCDISLDVVANWLCYQVRLGASSLERPFDISKAPLIDFDSSNQNQFDDLRLQLIAVESDKIHSINWKAIFSR